MPETNIWIQIWKRDPPRVDALWIATLAGFLVLTAALFVPYFGPLPFWFTIFGIVLLVLRLAGLSKALALLTAIGLTALLLWSVPQISAEVTRRDIEKYRLPEISPPRPIETAGDILLEIDNPLGIASRSSSAAVPANVPVQETGRPVDRSPYACNALCIRLLLEPGVASVTINDSAGLTLRELAAGTVRMSSRSRTYRIRPFGNCGSNEAQPIFASGSDFSGASDTHDEWVTRAIDELCLEISKSIGRHDLHIRSGLWGSPVAPSHWEISRFRFSHGPNPPPRPPAEKIAARYVEVRGAGNRLLARRFDIWARALDAPLRIVGTGFSVRRQPQYWLAWRGLPEGLRERSHGAKSFGLDQLLHINSSDKQCDLLDRQRQQLKQTLRDSSQSADGAILSSAAIYLHRLEECGAQQADVSTVRGLILDRRLADLDGAQRLTQVFDRKQMRSLRSAIAHKLATLPLGQEDRSGSNLSGIYNRWREGEFGPLLPEERHLLADSNRAVLAIGLIRHTPETGRVAAPLLASLIETHLAAMMANERVPDGLPKFRARNEHSQIVSEAMSSLCKMGSEADIELPRLTKLEGEPYFPRRDAKIAYFERVNWDVMMVSLGKSADAFRELPVGYKTREQYWERLRYLSSRSSYRWCERF